MPKVSLEAIESLVIRALRGAGACGAAAEATARALVEAEACGLSGHGLSRVGLYCSHLREGRADGAARPVVVPGRGGCCLVDARGGLAFEALSVAGGEAIARAREYGIAFVGVVHSHHAGAMAHHLQPLAAAGMVGLGFTNSPAAINAWGGRRPLFGTNPVAACFPRADAPALVVDLSLTEVARGKIMLYAEQGKSLPPGWALDRDGQPTTDAKAALTGSLAAVGGAKGAMLALVVELLCCALTGAAFGYENDSYFEPGNPPNIGHALLAIDPTALAGRAVYAERMEALVAAMLDDAGVRLPGSRRDAALARARAEGVDVPDALHAQIVRLAS